MYKININKQATKIAGGFENGLDGIVMVAPGEFIISNYTGILYYLEADGSRQVLLDTQAEKLMTNDISYDNSTKTLYVPAFNKNIVIAYRVR
ncbi:hypothetical protein [Chitinophaga parva]|uniref:hypothetical protein n=1 Tax=Chitinophaga parva TaxID=2169414 RepID=UPI00105724CB|nr:hypothetical protein [Chitinophaga parva]